MKTTSAMILVACLVVFAPVKMVHALFVPPIGGCWGDNDNDGDVDGMAAYWVAAQMGITNCQEGECPGDLNRDGKVDSEDMKKLASDFGRSNCTQREVWDDPCNEPVGGNVWNVSSASELENAVEDASSGDHIIVAPGTYSVAHLDIDKDITITGAGPTRTIFGLYGGEFAHAHDADQVVFRNLGLNTCFIFVENVHRFAVCNVAFKGSASYGLYPLWLQARDNENHLVRFIDSSINYNCGSGCIGIWIDNYEEVYNHILPRYDIQVKNSRITMVHFSGMRYNKTYRIFPGDPDKEEILTFDVALDVECDSFSGNNISVDEYSWDHRHKEMCVEGMP